jgi:flagellar motor switch/type III secretory pathway protein FliN
MTDIFEGEENNSSELNAQATEAVVADTAPDPVTEQPTVPETEHQTEADEGDAPVLYTIPNELRVLIGRTVEGLRHAPEANCGLIDDVLAYLKAH